MMTTIHIAIGDDADLDSIQQDYIDPIKQLLHKNRIDVISLNDVLDENFDTVLELEVECCDYDEALLIIGRSKFVIVD